MSHFLFLFLWLIHKSKDFPEVLLDFSLQYNASTIFSARASSQSILMDHKHLHPVEN